MESPAKQSLVSKVMAFQKQSANQKTKLNQKIEKPLKQNNDNKVELILQDYLYIYIIYLCLIISFLILIRLLKLPYKMLLKSTKKILHL